MSARGWIGVDLDGTIAHYEKYVGPTHIGEPIPAMVDRVKAWLADGHEVRIFTARMSDPDPVAREQVRDAVFNWTKIHVGVGLQATCIKDFAMWKLWDDRAVQVIPNTGRPVGGSTRGLS
ncbi:MAG: hypothetical protein AB7S41_08945 [Parvibaculaceae bacterium]